MKDYRIENFVAAPGGWWAVYYVEESGEYIYIPVVGWGDCDIEDTRLTSPIVVGVGGTLECASDATNFCEVIFTANAYHRINVSANGEFLYEIPSLPRRIPNTF